MRKISAAPLSRLQRDPLCLTNLTMATIESTQTFLLRSIWKLALLAALLTVSCSQRETVPSFNWVGTWSFPSLSQPGVSIQIILSENGTATERIGDFQGVGSWRTVANTARIDWDSKWVGILRSESGKIEMATWKPGSPTDGPPDDIQPASRKQ